MGNTKTEDAKPDIFCLAQESICQLKLVYDALEYATNETGKMEEGTDSLNGALIVIKEVIKRLDIITTNA